ncbi:SDR family NAD(P)-dependent oxidoreductase [Wenxinia saemankumensis]|uniref:NAD(P)-dependent dehydrogenase, short-chain alcohol dehydrogenase family n=1 Tax=Wenxinia saemankumensis TaxID=1447782 RepID=A0A1M6HV35_9RHOB|nr:SDR family oxidoreductase [Wenxinia saemankumensis]SHJ26050.1 NAD(P)-dependent dehydrogenase, short-chain alcohol dehydrogenase family [Wenxinia saemankumensis]
MRFAGRCALVTGAAGGIGAAIVALLWAEGAAVAATDRDTRGITAEALLPGDLRDRAFCDALPGAAREALGTLDIVVNNAGAITRGPVTRTGDDDFALSMAVNVEAPFRICRAAIPLIAADGGGAIVNIASCWGLRPGPNHALYCATKAALASLTQCMGLDHAGEGARVNAVCPNEVNTPMLRSGFARRGLDPDTAVADLGRTVPLGRIAEPEDIAEVALFLASDAARYDTGALYEVTEGNRSDEDVRGKGRARHRRAVGDGAGHRAAPDRGGGAGLHRAARSRRGVRGDRGRPGRSGGGGPCDV